MNVNLHKIADWTSLWAVNDAYPLLSLELPVQYHQRLEFGCDVKRGTKIQERLHGNLGGD